MNTVYIETTIVGHIAGRVQIDPLVADRQQVTRDWWRDHAPAYDAFHIAIAAVNGVDYLLTWNYKHIANATLRSRIEQVCRDAGFEPPIICTPDELVGTDDGS